MPTKFQKFCVFPTQVRLVVANTILFASFQGVSAQTWCGKNYKKDQPIFLPEGAFQLTEELHIPEFAFQCLPRIQPYLETDDCSAASVIVDTLTTFTRLRNSSPLPDSFEPSTSKKLDLSIETEGHRSIYKNIEFNAKNLKFPLSLCSLHPRKDPYTLTCSAELELANGIKRTYTSTSSLFYLPTPEFGSVTKLDRKVGALMTKTNGQTFEPIFPVGFYTDFGGYLASNLTILDDIKSQGFNVIHPVPPFGDATAFRTMLDHMDGIGLYLMYDMRHSYQHLESVTQQVKAIMDHKSLLLWYTADEPDGPGDPLGATCLAYDLVHGLDGYHPVSISLNCADHFFEEYVSGADIILPDVYMIGNDVKFSSKYDTPCTKEFGCCGCDNCEGRFEDISKRLDEAKVRLRILGWDNTKFIWAVPQAFGGEEFWTRAPTGREWLVQVILSINHGARGIMPWIDPTPKDIKIYASRFAKLLPQLVPYFFDDNVKFSHLNLRRVDIGLWQKGSKTLILATNLDDVASASSLLRADDQSRVTWILQEGVSRSITRALTFEPLGSAIFLSSPAEVDHLDQDKGHDEL